MNSVQIEKKLSESEGQKQITLVFCSMTPEPLIDAVEKEVQATVAEHDKDESISAKIQLVIALTPNIQLNLHTFQKQFGLMVPHYNQEFVQDGVGPKAGEPFELSLEFQGGDPNEINDEMTIIPLEPLPEPTISKPWWKIW